MSENLITSYGSAIEDFDYSIFEYIDKDLNIFCTTNEGWKKTKIIFSSPERSFISKADEELRDKNGTLIFPLITITRGDIKKPFNRSSMFGSNQFKVNDFKQNQILIHKEINQIKSAERARIKSKRINNQPYAPINNEKLVYNLYYIAQPTTLEIDYTIKIKTNFQQQMNEILGKFTTDLNNINYFVKERNNHKFEGFVDENFKNNSNSDSMEEEERFFETEVNIKMRGHIFDQTSNTPKVTIRESASDIIFTEEHVFKGSIEDYINSLNK